MRLKIGAVVLAALMLVGAAVAFAQAGDGADTAPDTGRAVVPGALVIGDTLKVTEGWVTQPAPQAAIRGYTITSPMVERARDELFGPHRGVLNCGNIKAVAPGGDWEDAQPAVDLPAGTYDVRIQIGHGLNRSCAASLQDIATFRVTLGS